MPLLAQLLTSLFGSFIAGLTKDLSRKATTLVVATGSFAVAAVTLMAAFRLVVKPLALAMFSTQYGQVIGLAFPPVAGSCIAAITACWIACAAYKMQLLIIKTTASA